MAELVAGAFLSSFFQVTLERLASTDLTDYFHRGKLDSLVEDLENKLNSFNQVLDEAETKQHQSKDVKRWLDDLKHAVYEADQLLDEIVTDAPLKKLKAESQPATRKVLGLFSAFTNNPFESRIKELLQNLDSLAKQKDMLGLKEVTCACNEGGVRWKSSNRLPTTYLVDESRICGRDGDKEEIIKFLLSDNYCGSQVPVISIVGLGGMGKTTLAQLVYNDPRMQKQFELKAWVYVSESFDDVRLTKAFLRAFQTAPYGKDLNLLQHQLQQTLRGKKYLLVLDDVWNRNGESWERLLRPFNHGSSGSRIIVTTRDKEVASNMESAQTHPLEQLEDSNCWSLFVRHAFQGKNVGDYPNLESIGKKIVNKCGGLPIAIKTLGNLLRRKFSQREWVKILETDMWRLSENNSNINPTLRLSYHNLPSNLKRCFAYCSILRKGSFFDKDQLIKLWMAEGLLKCCGTNKSEEELGNEFFDDLQSISFFQQCVNPWNGEYYFVMHDLVHNLAKSVSGDFCLQIVGDRVQDIPKRTRHIECSLKLKDGDKILEHICECKGLRSLMVEGFYKISNKVQHDLFSRLKYLRMLSFRGCDILELSDEISNLKLLRYLDLSRTKITSLPDSICTLYNLQTLILTSCPLTELPLDFNQLVNLRHLHVEDTSIEKMPKHIGRLVHLQTLPIDFVVGEHNLFDIKELANLSHLRGKLCILGLKNVTDPADVAEANLKDKKHLEELCIMYGDNDDDSSYDGSSDDGSSYDGSIIEKKHLEELCMMYDDGDDDPSYDGSSDDGSTIESDVFVLEALQPNSKLNKLTIKDYRGSSFPNWLGDCHHLPNLVSLELTNCKFCTRLPPLGQLPSLKDLSISRCDGIEIIGPENGPFRSLKNLAFEDLLEWKEWLCFEGFPLLEELYITLCPKLKSSLPQHLPSLQTLEISDCEELGPSIPNAANLHSLHLYDCPQLELFPGGGFPSNLSSLRIYKCPRLVALREEWGLFKLHSLKEFSVRDDFENVESFPEESLLPPTLESLELYNCSKLRVINCRGLLHLKSLKSLSIRKCPCLVRLPEEGLPNSLSSLEIYGCPLLQQLYKEEGERWHKIRHIPSVTVNYHYY